MQQNLPPQVQSNNSQVFVYNQRINSRHRHFLWFLSSTKPKTLNCVNGIKFYDSTSITILTIIVQQNKKRRFENKLNSSSHIKSRSALRSSASAFSRRFGWSKLFTEKFLALCESRLAWASYQWLMVMLNMKIENLKSKPHTEDLRTPSD